MQDEIDRELPADLSALTLLNSWCSSSHRFIFTRPHQHFHSLLELKLDGVVFKELRLTPENTPNIVTLSMTNVGSLDSMDDFEVFLPNLEELEIFFMESDKMRPLNAMLAAATHLVSFKSRKLWVNGTLKFASDSLVEVTIVRSDCLQGLRIESPVLELVNVTASYDVSRLTILPNKLLGGSVSSDIQVR